MFKILSIQTSSKRTLKKDDRLRRTASENILFHLNALKNSQEMFDEFMEVVEEDVKNKTNILKSLRIKTNWTQIKTLMQLFKSLCSSAIQTESKVSTKLLRPPLQMSVRSTARITEMMTKLVILWINIFRF